MSTDPPTQADWHRRLAPDADDGILVLNLDDAAQQLTGHPAVQNWLHDASFEAARGLEGPDAAAQAQAHSQMLRALKERFPALVEAVRAVTDGCGAPVLKWRPLAPGYSQVQIGFEEDLAEDPDVFCKLEAPALSAARRALQAVADALPAGRPFPNRPNRAAGVLACGGRCLGVRYREQADGEALRRSVVLVPGEPSTDALDEAEAARGIVAFFAPQDREMWYEQ